MRYGTVTSSPRIRSGFTLIELLVVISIITLLISILLPAVGETRRQARISLCTANMKQHGQGASNFASQNQDYLPNAPKSNGKNAAEAGRNGKIARYFGSVDLPVNGFTFQNPGAQTCTSPGGTNDVLNNSEYMQNLQIWNGYWVILSEHMVDGEGAAALNNVFLSPSDTGTKPQWPLIKKWVAAKASSDSTGANGWWKLSGGNSGSQQTIGDNVIIPKIAPYTGSYRYVVTAITDYKLYSFDKNGNALTDKDALAVDFGAGGSKPEFDTYVRRNPVAAVDYPSQKVLFFMWFAWHNPANNAWFETGVTCPVAMADGSARASVPSRDGLAYHRDNENAGPYIGVYFRSNPGTAWYTHYMLNVGGIKGRDL